MPSPSSTSDEAVTRRASQQHGLVALSGDATVTAVLDEADIDQSDVVVAMLRRDATTWRWRCWRAPPASSA